MTCPICDAVTDPDYRPFCSRRCADLDLGKWLNGSYAIPSRDLQEIENDQDEVDGPETRPH